MSARLPRVRRGEAIGMTADRMRIVVADDHALAREGMQHLFGACSNMTVVGAAADGAEALEIVERLRPDVLVLDIRMPRVSGIEVARRTREISSGTKILAVSAYDDDEYILALMAAGVAGYLMKTTSSSQLVDAVERVCEGESVLHPTIARKVARLWARRRADKRGAAGRLTGRELHILQLAATGRRNKAIAEELGISVRSVEAHLRGVYSKLGVSSRVQAVLYALSHNLITMEDSDNF